VAESTWLWQLQALNNSCSSGIVLYSACSPLTLDSISCSSSVQCHVSSSGTLQAHACEMLRFCCAIVYMNVCLRAPMTIFWYLLANLGHQCRLYRFAFNGCAFSNLLHTVNHEQGKTQKALQEGFMCNVLRYTASSRDHVHVRNPLTGRKSDHLGVRQCRTGTKFSQVMRHNHAKLQSTATMPL
jgi:hypothetical protein